jgi:hypothetical protein
MRQKRLTLSAVLLLGLGLTSLQAQTMNVKEKSGAQTAYTLSSVRKMTFSGGNVTVNKTNNTSGVFALSALRYLNFTSVTSGISEPTMQSGHSNLVTYPNPVTDVLNIDLTGVIGEGMISILTFEGKVVQTQTTSGNSMATINLSHLAKGIYLCRYSSTSEIKTVKIVKQ